MFLRIEAIEERTLIGKVLEMSLSEGRTTELWQSFMPLLKTINNQKNDLLYSLQIYPDVFDMYNFTPQVIFTKWAAVEVSDDTAVPDTLSKLNLPSGTYAVFLHKGPASDFYDTMEYIYQRWLPQSGYQVADRPHFELLSKKYKNNDPKSEEEVWIPITEKAQ